jgi:cytidine deaminase
MDHTRLREKWADRLAALDVDQLRPLTRKDALDLLAAAFTIRSRAYAPYSRLEVGAAILCADHKIFAGVNVENASYGATICAERAAACNAVSAGCRRFIAVSVVADFPRPIPPCGLCRQVLAEFTRRAPVIMANLAGDIDVRSIEELLPLTFELGEPKAPGRGVPPIG